MNARAIKPLGDVARILMGQSPPGETYNDGGQGLPFFQGKAQFGQLHPTPDKWCSAPIRIAVADDVLVSVRAPVGPTNRAVETCCIGRGLASIRTAASILDQDYLHWFMRYSEPALAAKGSGSTFQAVGRKEIASLMVPLPPLDEQRRIVGLLDRAAEIRRRADAARVKARAIIPALFLDTFGDPATNPKKWPIIALAEALLSGPQNGLYRPSTDYGSGVRILRIDSFDNGAITNQSALKRLHIDRETIKKFQLSEGDVVVNRVNSPPQLGKAVLIPELEEPVVFESNMMRMKVNPKILLPSMLGVMLQLGSIRQVLTRNAKHAINQSSINQGDVTGIAIFVPPIAQQRIFTEHVHRLECLARHLDAAAVKAEAMSAALSAEVFG